MGPQEITRNVTGEGTWIQAWEEEYTLAGRSWSLQGIWKSVNQSRESDSARPFEKQLDVDLVKHRVSRCWRERGGHSGHRLQMAWKAKLSLAFINQQGERGITWSEVGQSTGHSRDGLRAPAPKQAAKGVGGRRSCEHGRKHKETGQQTGSRASWHPSFSTPAAKRRLRELLPARKTGPGAL